MNESQLGDHILLGIVGHRYYIIIPEEVCKFCIHHHHHSYNKLHQRYYNTIANTLAYSTLWHSHIILSMKYMYESAGVLRKPPLREKTYFSTIIVRKKKCKHTRNKYEKILISWLLQLLMLLPKQSRRFLIILPVKYRWGATIAFILWITNISI